MNQASGANRTRQELERIRQAIDEAKRARLVRAGVLDRTGRINSRFADYLKRDHAGNG